MASPEPSSLPPNLKPAWEHAWEADWLGGLQWAHGKGWGGGRLSPGDWDVCACLLCL